MRPPYASSLVALLALAACDIGVTTLPPREPSPQQTRVVRVDLVPDTVAFGDTVLIHVVIEDSLDAGFRYAWGMPDLVPVDGRLDGPRVRYVPPNIGAAPGEVRNIGALVRITNDMPGTRAVRYTFPIPVQY